MREIIKQLLGNISRDPETQQLMILFVLGSFLRGFHALEMLLEGIASFSQSFSLPSFMATQIIAFHAGFQCCLRCQSWDFGIWGGGPLLRSPGCFLKSQGLRSHVPSRGKTSFQNARCLSVLYISIHICTKTLLNYVSRQSLPLPFSLPASIITF